MVQLKNNNNETLDLELIKEKLFTRKRELEEEFIDNGSTDGAGQIADSAEQASLTTLETIKVSLQSAELIEYKSILQSLRMIEEGTYGLCVECNQPIAPKRLLLFANAVRCLPCQELLEEGDSE